jgi:hypothetical protein
MTDRVTRRHFVRAASTSAALAAAGTGVLAHGNDSRVEQGGWPVAKQRVAQAELVPGMTIGRMLLGGNLLTHYTHSRDLRYVYTLAARYNTKEKIFETMALAEAHGVNTVVIHTAAGVVDWLQEYRNLHGGKMKWIICPTANITEDMKAYTDACKMLRDIGTDSIYLWGVRGDQFGGVDLGGGRSTPRPDLIAKAVEAAKDVGLPAGVGAHRLETIKCCEQNDIAADYYVKTLHSADYPSVNIGHDNRWSYTPDETIQFMKGVKKPWIAFKVMAAGAIGPRDGFTHAFQNGADFSLAGMFDYEIAENVATMNQILTLASVTNRPRPWIV